MRIQLDFPPERVEELEDLMRGANIATKKELFNNALTLLEWAISERKRGRLVGSFDEGGNAFREVLLPAFIAIQAQLPSEETQVNQERLLSLLEVLIASRQEIESISRQRQIREVDQAKVRDWFDHLAAAAEKYASQTR